MRQTLHATVTLSVSIVATIAVLALILPEHPAGRGADHMTSSAIRLAVLDQHVDARVVPAGEAAACPFLMVRTSATACPFLARTASSACPFLAGRAANGSSCPFLDSRVDEQTEPRCPWGGGGLPAGPSPEVVDKMQLPVFAANREASDRLPSEVS